MFGFLPDVTASVHVESQVGLFGCKELIFVQKAFVGLRGMICSGDPKLTLLRFMHSSGIALGV